MEKNNNDVTSYKFTATSGFPQGPHFRPFLFLLFDNDVLIIFNDVHVLMFHYDTKIYKAIRNTNDCQTFSSNLLKNFVWSQNNVLQLNVSKCLN